MLAGAVLGEADGGVGAVAGEGGGGVAGSQVGAFAVGVGVFLDGFVAELHQVFVGVAGGLRAADLYNGIGVVAVASDAEADLGSVGTGEEGEAVVGAGGGEAVVFAQFGHIALGGFVEQQGSDIDGVGEFVDILGSAGEGEEGEQQEEGGYQGF